MVVVVVVQLLLQLCEQFLMWDSELALSVHNLRTVEQLKF